MVPKKADPFAIIIGSSSIKVPYIKKQILVINSKNKNHPVNPDDVLFLKHEYDAQGNGCQNSICGGDVDR